MKKILSILSVTILLSGLFACKKVEGPGGSSTIKGVIKAKIDDGFGGVLGTYFPAEEDVYIIYGGDSEDTYFDDDVKTSYDGSFEFNYLEKGTYRIFVYSDNNSVFGGEEALIYEVEITDKKQTIEMDTIEIWK